MKLSWENATPVPWHPVGQCWWRLVFHSNRCDCPSTFCCPTTQNDHSQQKKSLLGVPRDGLSSAFSAQTIQVKTHFKDFKDQQMCFKSSFKIALFSRGGTVVVVSNHHELDIFRRGITSHSTCIQWHEWRCVMTLRAVTMRIIFQMIMTKRTEEPRYDQKRREKEKTLSAGRNQRTIQLSSGSARELPHRKGCEIVN